MKGTDITIEILPTVFPDQFALNAEKDSVEYGLQIASSIQYEWFWKGGTNGRFYDQVNSFRMLRLYARGEQPIDKYKSEIAYDGDLSHLNLDWTPVPIIPKYVDIVVNGMSDRLFQAKAFSQDAMSQSNRNKFQDLIEGQMVAKDVLEQIQEMTGVNTFATSPDELPQTDEELSLYMQLKYKPAIEIAEEIAISTVCDENHWNDIKKRIDYDQTVLGIGIAKHQFLDGVGIVLDYVDPEYTIYSYTEDPFFKDVFYWGEIKTVALNEIYKIKPDVTKDEMETIAQYSTAWFDNFNLNQYYQSPLYRTETCTLMYFNYKTTRKEVYKKKITKNGGTKIIEKDDTFNPSEEDLMEGRFEKIERTIDVWYDGVMVMGTNIMLKWELSENMVREKSTTQHAISNYVACAPRMYKGVIESLCRRMIPFADLIQITHLKIQQVLSRVVPDGVFIDADGLNEVDLGTGANYNPAEALRLYFQTGSVIGRSNTQDGDFNHAKIPIQQLTTNSGANKLQMLIANYNHYLDMIRAVTGLNEARDGSSPDPNALVGVQKLAALNSNTATRHILDAGLVVYRGIAEALTYRVADLLQYSDLKEAFANRIGKYNVSLLNEIKELYLYDFGIYIEISPDEEQKANLENNIQIALAQKLIDLSDAIDIREIKNIKVANQLLKLKQKKREEREERMAMQNQAVIAQQQLQSQEMASKLALDKVQLDTQSKLQIIEAESNRDIKVLNREAELKQQLMEVEFNYNRQIADLEGRNISSRDAMKEDRKDKRTDLQATQQSDLINQRQLNLPPKQFSNSRFESSGNDTMDDLSFNDINVMQ